MRYLDLLFKKLLVNSIYIISWISKIDYLMIDHIKSCLNIWPGFPFEQNKLLLNKKTATYYSLSDVTVIRGYWKRKIQFRDWDFTFFWSGKVGFTALGKGWTVLKMAVWFLFFRGLRLYYLTQFCRNKPILGNEEIQLCISNPQWQCMTVPAWKKGRGPGLPNNFDWHVFKLKFGQLPRSSRCSSVREASKLFIYVFNKEKLLEINTLRRLTL